MPLRGSSCGQIVTVLCAALLPADIDATGIHWLDDLVDELREDSIQLVLCNPAKMVRLPSLRSEAALWSAGCAKLVLTQLGASAACGAAQQCVQPLSLAGS